MFVFRRLNCIQTRLDQSSSPTVAFDSGANDWEGFTLMWEWERWQPFSGAAVTLVVLAQHSEVVIVSSGLVLGPESGWDLACAVPVSSHTFSGPGSVASLGFLGCAFLFFQ